LKAKALADPQVKAAYDALEPEYKLITELLRARKKSGLTQAQVATRMGTTNTVVARLEGGGGRKRHSPSFETLRRYASAVGKRLDIRLL
jgi:transcriptional regulator with XRE-family HTH domain